MNQYIKLSIALFIFAAPTLASAATDWSAQDYDLYTGDFDGDGKADLLHIAKDPSKVSGITRSDGSGPNQSYQTWPSNYLGIPWHSNLYTVLVADFNGDQKSDILLQRNGAGDSFLILTDASGRITAVSQTISDSYMGLVWSGGGHKIITGDFNGDGKADVFLQATSSSGTHAIALADANGQFTGSLSQTWTDSSWGAFKWSTTNSVITAGDFNGDTKTDLLIQARPNIILIDYDVPIPVPTYQPNTFGVVYSQGGSTPFSQTGVQQWSRTANGVDWSPLSATAIVGDFNGDGKADVLLQAKNSSRSTYLLNGNASGAAFSSGSAVSSNVTISGDGARLVVGKFTGSGGAGIYIQTLSPGGDNYLATSVSTSITAVSHNPTVATGVVPATAVGYTPGSYAVSNMGSATYSIPIVVPPGVNDLEPKLAIAYDSNSGNGLLGMGWNIAGLSEIERCKKTLAQDNSNDAVLLTTADRFCLDGNKLRMTGGSYYGAGGSTYQTELETFSRITASGTAGNGPAYFTVETKSGLKYEYGNTSDSRIEAVNAPSNSTTPHTWALNKLSDRYGNTMTITYEEDGSSNGSYRPSEIAYTANSNASLAAAYRVQFFWDTRPSNDTPSGYVAGGLVKETKRLNRIETQYNEPGVGWRLVRKYQLSYNDSSSTHRSRLASVQECDRNGSCLSPTMISWTDGTAGWSASDLTSSSSSTATMESSYPIDFDGDGRDDLVYPQFSGSTAYWYYMKANASGGFDSPVNTGLTAGTSSDDAYAKALPMDYAADGRRGLLVNVPGSGALQLLRWNGSAFVQTATNATYTLSGRDWVSDFDGDGLEDVMYAPSTSGTGTLWVYKNSGTAITSPQFAAATQFYSASIGGAYVDQIHGGIWAFSDRTLDFNGDGRADFVFQTSEYVCPGDCAWLTTWTALQSTGTSFVAVQSWTCNIADSTSCQLLPLVGDFNGDGLTDVITQYATLENPTISFKAFYGSGTGLTGPTAVTLPAYFNTSGFSADYDGDGRADLIYAPSPTSGTWAVARSTGTGFESQVNLTIPSGSANNTVRAMDMDGDGQPDIGYKNSTYRIRRHNGAVPDRVRAFTDGFGNSATVTYSALTDSLIYTKGTGATYPKRDLQIPLYVVSKTTASDGIGANYDVTEKYSGLRADMQGRGLLGFAGRESMDKRTDIKSTVSFLQDYPYIGLVSSVSVYQPNSGPLMTQTTNTPAVLVLDSTAYNDRRYPYFSQVVQESYEVGGPSNGLSVARVTTATQLDSYANPTSVTTTKLDLTGSAESYTSTTANTYATADTTNWCLDFVPIKR